MYRAVWTGVRLPSAPLNISWRCIRVQKTWCSAFFDDFLSENRWYLQSKAHKLIRIFGNRKITWTFLSFKMKKAWSKFQKYRLKSVVCIFGKYLSSRANFIIKNSPCNSHVAKQGDALGDRDKWSNEESKFQLYSHSCDGYVILIRNSVAIYNCFDGFTHFSIIIVLLSIIVICFFE